MNKYPHYKVVNLNKLTYAANFKNLKKVENNPNYKFIKGDISDRDFIFDIFEKEKFDIVVNFAAESHVNNSIANPKIFVITNILGTQISVDASKKYKVERFHQVYVKDRPGHDLRYAINATKIEIELKWKTKYKFEEGIVETIKWYVKNNGK